MTFKTWKPLCVLGLVPTYSVKTGDGKFSCTLCDYITRDKYNIRRHLDGKHDLTGGYRCEKCFKQLNTKQSLSQHRLHCFQPAYWLFWGITCCNQSKQYFTSFSERTSSIFVIQFLFNMWLKFEWNKSRLTDYLLNKANQHDLSIATTQFSSVQFNAV